MYNEDGNFVGTAGWMKPKRDYQALEFVIDRAWDDRWSFNASYTLSFSEGNAEGPVNSDTDFADSGRTEAFDNPWVNFDGERLPAERSPPPDQDARLLRDQRAVGIGATLDARSGRPISAFGVGNPFDETVVPQLLHFERGTTGTSTRCSRAATEAACRGPATWA